MSRLDRGAENVGPGGAVENVHHPQVGVAEVALLQGAQPLVMARPGKAIQITPGRAQPGIAGAQEVGAVRLAGRLPPQPARVVARQRRGDLA